MPALIELQPETLAGASLVACAESLAPRLADTAQQHDAAGQYPMENIGLHKQADYFIAPIPQRFGGRGVESLYDLLGASSRLARGDASTTIGLNMHLLILSDLVRRWRIASHRGLERRAAAYAQSLRQIVDEGTIIAAAVSEPNQHLTQPVTRATRNGTGWLLNGRKIFCTMSPAATVLLTSTSYVNQHDELLYTYAEVPVTTPGVTIHDDWDSLGMRTSGSNSVSFKDVHLPESALRGGFPAGTSTGYMERNVANGLFHARRTDRAPGSAEQMLVAENAIGLSAMRATFGRAAHLVDALHCEHLTGDADSDELHSAFAEVQAAKAFVNETAARIVDRALTLSGGAAYARASAGAGVPRPARWRIHAAA